MTEPTYLLDVNALIALANDGHVHHRSAHRWFATAQQWATTPITEAGFVRVQSNPAVVGTATATLPHEAIAALHQMRVLPGHRWVPDDATFTDPTIELTTMTGPKQVTDFHLVNLAARHGLTLATFDGRLRDALHADDRQYVQLIPTI